MGRLGAYERVILKWIVEKYSGHGRTRGMCEGNIIVDRREIEWTWED